MPLYQLNGRNLLFIHVPKTGGKSVEAYLKSLSGGQALFHPRKQDIFPCSPQHMHAEMLELLFGESYVQYSFMVVRNPYRRFVSEYHWRVTRKGGEQDFESWSHQVLDELEHDLFILDNHLRPQIEFRMRNTVVHRLEDGLENAVHAAVQAVGLDLPVPVLDHTHRTDKAEVSGSRGLAERLKQLYAADFEAFGYDPEDLAKAFHLA